MMMTIRFAERIVRETPGDERDDPFTSRSHRVAARDGARRGSATTRAANAARRSARAANAIEKIGRVDSREHRGGSGARASGGVSTIRVHREGIDDGDCDSLGDRRPARRSYARGPGSRATSLQRDPAHARRSYPPPRESAVAPFSSLYVTLLDFSRLRSTAVAVQTL